MRDQENTRGARDGNGPASPRKQPAPLGGLLGLQAAAGNAAVVQRLRRDGHPWAQSEPHRHGAGCGHQAGQPAVQRSAVHDVLRTSGRPLDEATRSDMEARLGADFSDVRIHDDAAAKASAAEVGARAYTSGSHVVIGDGGADKHTLAHELTHVIQQRRGPVAGADNGAGLKVSDPSDRFEREAEATATRVMSGTGRQQSSAAGVDPDGSGKAPAVRTPAATAVQRSIKVTLAGYAQAKGAAGAQDLTRQQVGEYASMAVLDDYYLACDHAADGGVRLKQLYKELRTELKAGGTGHTQVEALATEVNSVLSELDPTYRENKRTRYAIEEKGAKEANYKNSRVPPNGMEGEWGKDDVMWDMFGRGIETSGFLDAPATTGRVGTEPLKQLTWDQARQLLPRPLLNLLFDVRYQLESGTVVDERTDDERTRRETTPNAPGTLRSWHQDDRGRLPATGANHNQGEANFRSRLPQESQALHDHYKNTSGTGAGSSIQVEAEFPRGFAEYTGTGTNSEHNTKVVLDYVQKRVYLTLTHYQLWGLFSANGRTYMVPSNTQDVNQAPGKIEDKMPGLRIPKGTQYTLMNPWVEILM